MGNRSASRAKMVLPLRLWGKDTLGRQFVQLAHTLDLSATGLRVAGFRCAVRVGETIWVQYKHYKAQFRVAWVGGAGSSRENQIGIEYLEKEKRIFGLDMRNDAYVDDYEPPVIQDAVEQYSKTRSYTRYPVSGGAEVRQVNARSGHWGSLVDLSLGGCYVQTPRPLPLNTRTKLMLKLGGEEVEMWGHVRTCHSDVGMGIEFTDAVSDADGARLKGLLARLEAGEEMSGAHGPKLNPDKFAERLKAALAELTELESGLAELAPHADMLRHYRSSLGQLRTSGWALERWFEMQEFGLETAPVFQFLFSERTKTSIQFLKELSRQLREPRAKLSPQDSAELLRAVENLFAHLTGFSVADEAVREEPIAEPVPVAFPEIELPAKNGAAPNDGPLGTEQASEVSAGVPGHSQPEADSEQNNEAETVEPARLAEELALAAAATNGAVSIANESEQSEASATKAARSKRPPKKKPEKRTRWKRV